MEVAKKVHVAQHIKREKCKLAETIQNRVMGLEKTSGSESWISLKTY